MLKHFKRSMAAAAFAGGSLIGGVGLEPVLAQQPPVTFGPPAVLPVEAPAPPAALPPEPDPFWRAAPSGYAVIAGPKAIELNQAGGPFDHRPIEVRRGEPYAYGWFGGVDRSKWHRQFGPNRRYTQWSLR